MPMPDNKIQEIISEIDTKRAEPDLLTEAADDAASPYDEGSPERSKLLAVIRAVIPFKGDRPLELVRKSVFIVSVITAIVCLAVILGDMNTSRDYEKLSEEIQGQKEYYQLHGEIPLAPEIIEEIREEVPDIMDEYIATYNENNDTVGWITIPGTVIDYPVMQTTDNQYYLENNFKRQKSSYGAIFATFLEPFTPTSRPNNTILYGHNIFDGACFAAVAHYYSEGSINFYRKHPIVYFDTIYEKGAYKVFAAIYAHTSDTKEQDVYPYHLKTTFENKAEFYDFAQNILDRSCFYTDVDLEYGDEIITLSTCYYPLGNNFDSRVALFARRVREGESEEVNLDAAYRNPSPLYFDYYYRVMGGSWAGRNWDTGKVLGLDEYLFSQQAVLP